MNHFFKFLNDSSTTIDIYSYKILAPAILDSEPDPKTGCGKCIESVGLDEDLYRIGHTKARIAQCLFLNIISVDFDLSLIVCSC